jgi:hypothetical protein
MSLGIGGCHQWFGHEAHGAVVGLGLDVDSHRWFDVGASGGATPPGDARVKYDFFSMRPSVDSVDGRRQAPGNENWLIIPRLRRLEASGN